MEQVAMSDITSVINDLKKQKIILEPESYRNHLLKKIGNTLTVDTMQGNAFLKPHGYAGDYEIIDKIYMEWHSPDSSLRVWDKYFHLQSASTAVRNRKKYFISLVKKVATRKSHTNILNIGSGPGRDMLEYFRENPHGTVSFECVDIDENAINYAKSLCHSYLDRINFINKNIFRYKTSQKYDLVWSAGLFDYFDDRRFIFLLKKLYSFVGNNGQLVVGNFEPSNPTKDYMEVVADWYLFHRSKKQLISLAQEAGIRTNNISVYSEPLGVNLFLHIRKDAFQTDDKPGKK